MASPAPAKKEKKKKEEVSPKEVKVEDLTGLEDEDDVLERFVRYDTPGEF